jgi:hypothetical protein
MTIITPELSRAKELTAINDDPNLSATVKSLAAVAASYDDGVQLPAIMAAAGVSKCTVDLIVQYMKDHGYSDQSDADLRAAVIAYYGSSL